jgi:hypothetical protein
MENELKLGRATFVQNEDGIVLWTGPASVRVRLGPDDVLSLYAWLGNLLGRPEEAR